MSVAQQNIINGDIMVTGIKGLAISPNDPTNFQDFLKNKVASKIPLVTQDNDVPDMSIRRCYIGTHNYRVYRAAGALVEKAIPDGGKIAIFVGQMDATNAVRVARQGLFRFISPASTRSETAMKTPADAADSEAWKVFTRRHGTDNGQENTCQK